MAYSCPQCRAVVELPPERIADRCAFCETPLVRAQELGLPFESAAPFEVKRDLALTHLQRHLQQHRWAPNAVRRIRTPELLHGVMIPFYVYSGVARSEYSAKIGLYWYRTETYTVIENGKAQKRTRTVRETEWFNIRGSHARSYTDQLASGSAGLAELEANALEPFDLGKTRPFVPSLLAGWIAEQPTIDPSQARKAVQAEITELENAAIRAFLPGDEIAGVENQSSIQIERVRLVLLPVWVATFRHERHVMRLLVNGQTGLVIGKVPVSKLKVALTVFLILLLTGAIVLGILLAQGRLQ